MKAYVTSLGEPTTELCIWSLERNGFDVVLIQSNTSLAEKLKEIYNQAADDFLRVDADVVPNRLCLPPLSRGKYWWYQYQCFDWYKQDVMNGGIQLVKKECLSILRENVDRFINAERPETELSRIPEFDNPRRFQTLQGIMGIHGYGQRYTGRIRGTKERRGQMEQYDFELAERLSRL